MSAPLRRRLDPPGGRCVPSQTWMVTFADLVALMLTFFVLLFSMSQVEQEQWRSLIDSLANRLNTVRPEAPGKPAVEFQVEPELPAPAANLDYLAPVLAGQIAADPALSAARLWRRPDALVLSLPSEVLFAPGSADPAPGAEAMVFAAGGILRNLSNAIEVVGYAEAGSKAGEGPVSWENALARAVGVARMLAASGFTGVAPALALGGSEAESAADASGPALSPPGRRVDIVIRDRASEAP